MKKISILLYADDIVLLIENKLDLQTLLNALNEWCNVNDMQINCTKSNAVHFRPPSVEQVASSASLGTLKSCGVAPIRIETSRFDNLNNLYVKLWKPKVMFFTVLCMKTLN